MGLLLYKLFINNSYRTLLILCKRDCRRARRRVFRLSSDLGDPQLIVCLNVGSTILSRSNSDGEQLAPLRSSKFNFVYHVCNRELCST
jgi:hypothetical protein